MPNYLCPDGKTTAGPTGRCLRNADGKCGWEIIECPVQECPTVAKPTCSEGQSLTTKVDDKGCIVGYECVSVTRAECNIDSDCKKGTCPDGSTYQQYSCSNSKCMLINYIQDPCTSATNTGSAITGKVVLGAY